MRVIFYLNHSLLPRAWIHFRQEKVWEEFKFERSPYSCLYCGKLTRESRFCNEAKDMCLGFEGKLVSFGKWLSAGTNLKVPDHVKRRCPVKRVVNTCSNAAMFSGAGDFQFSVMEVEKQGNVKARKKKAY